MEGSRINIVKTCVNDSENELPSVVNVVGAQVQQLLGVCKLAFPEQRLGRLLRARNTTASCVTYPTLLNYFHKKIESNESLCSFLILLYTVNIILLN